MLFRLAHRTAIVVTLVVVGTLLVAAPAPAASASRWYFSNRLVGGSASLTLDFGPDSDTDFYVGDWDGDGIDDLAHRSGKTFTLLNIRTRKTSTISYGKETDEVFVGDWDGNGTDSFAVRRGREFFIKNSVAGGPADAVITYGKATDEVFVGDWDGDGDDTFAVRRANMFFVKNSVASGNADVVFGYGRANDAVMVGDWNGDRIDTFAVRRGNMVYLRNDFRSGVAQVSFGYGKATDEIYAGDWNADGIDTFVVRRGGGSPNVPASVPVSGDFPSAATTGLSDASVLRPSGTVIVTTPGAVIENLDVTGTIVVKADNVTIRNVRVRKSVGTSYGISTGFGEYTGTVIEHVELDGQRDVSGNSGSIGVCCDSYTLRHANIYGFRISATMSGNNVVESSWMHDHWGANGSHGEAIQSTGGSNMIVRNNNLDITGSSGATGALALFGNTSPITNVLVERNLFYGGGYCAYGGSSPEKPYPVATNIRFIDNHFRTTPGTYETCGRFGPVTAFNRSYEGNVWQGNVWHETGSAIP